METTTVQVQPTQHQHLLASALNAHTRTGTFLRVLIMAFGTVIGAASLRTLIAQLSAPDVFAKDFLQPYLLGRAIRDGVDPYQPVQILVDRYLGTLPFHVFPHPSPHPPPSAVLMLPLSFLNYQTAAILWFGIEITFVAASVYLLARTQGARLSAVVTLPLTLALIAWFPFNQDLYWGQLGALQLFLMVVAMLFLRRGQRTLGGALLGLSILVKPTPWPVLTVFLLRREWRALGASLATVLLGYVVSGWAIGFDRLATYFAVGLPASTAAYRSHWANWSVWTIGWRLFDGTSSGPLTGILVSVEAPPLVKAPAAAGLVAVAVPALVLVIAIAVAHKQRSLDAAFGVMLCAALLVSPVSWSHYVELLCLPIAWIIGQLYHRRFAVSETNAAIIVGALLAASSDSWWATLGWITAGCPAPTGAGVYVLQFWPALLTLGPILAVCALGWLVVRLGTPPAASDSTR